MGRLIIFEGTSKFIFDSFTQADAGTGKQYRWCRGATGTKHSHPRRYLPLNRQSRKRRHTDAAHATDGRRVVALFISEKSNLIPQIMGRITVKLTFIELCYAL